ncbi:hypothetical protein Y883_21210 [Luteibacter rhizovicinus DSM 16549]|nr:hypothetical protein Y883_21210 [Luteibacter rhizovicinus DSM 16549]
MEPTFFMCFIKSKSQMVLIKVHIKLQVVKNNSVVFTIQNFLEIIYCNLCETIRIDIHTLILLVRHRNTKQITISTV